MTITLNESNLPSRNVPYKVKEFSMEWFKPKQLTLLSKAVHLSSTEPVIEAMGQVITGLDVRELTVGDFFYLLTLQRLNCFKDRPLNAEWQCQAAVFRRADANEVYTPDDIDELVDVWREASEEERESLEDPDEIHLEGDVCGTVNYIPIEIGDFRMVMLRDIEMPEGIDFPRVKTLTSFLKMQKDAEHALISEACQYIKAGDSLEDKLQLLLDGEDMEFFGQLNDATLQFVHGISREIHKKCEGCGHDHVIAYTVDASSFFM